MGGGEGMYWYAQIIYEQYMTVVCGGGGSVQIYRENVCSQRVNDASRKAM